MGACVVISNLSSCDITFGKSPSVNKADSTLSAMYDEDKYDDSMDIAMFSAIIKHQEKRDSILKAQPTKHLIQLDKKKPIGYVDGNPVYICMIDFKEYIYIPGLAFCKK